MATEHDMAEDEDEVSIFITPAIERDYRRRNVLAEMWSDCSDKVLPNGTFVHKNVRIGFARDVLLKDAEHERWHGNGPRGCQVAYTALIKRIKADLEEAVRKITLPFPELVPVWMPKPWDANPARFKVGEAAMLWAPRHTRHGEVVEIVRDLNYGEVGARDGPYLAKDGRRVDYKEAYLAKSPGGEAFAFYPHQLRDPDGKVRHLRIVEAA